MEIFKILLKDNFLKFWQKLQDYGTVYAPVQVSPKSYSFKAVSEPQNVAWQALRTILPPKKFFFKENYSPLFLRNSSCSFKDKRKLLFE